ncbi:MAG: methylenetetrahydrofolate--tRNA-(uracil(54)-C(5))-methyltransferase (FADH(2)-oxidizing) TrmFO [Candidatus Hydrothermae bacterium]|nr:methylenetetrahydrofolate--tRNA-(uracil(54)-C(5))-methyltransferase (FADH(2)-oxidizing) TrmFO [Candidatus Hydrothermae bacterium]
MTTRTPVVVIGGGLAGSEAAYQLAVRGIPVVLYEMRPTRQTPAHRSDRLGELVCSNSLKSRDLYNAQGLLKEELRALGSLILRAAEEAALPGGKALTVDRDRFAQIITETLEAHPLIELRREEVTSIPEEGVVIVATGPLTSDAFAEALKALTGEAFLAFYDAVSPIVDGDTLNYDKLYWKDRHGWDDSAYLNAPMSREEYERFVQALLEAETVEPHGFEESLGYFEGCLPIEEMARRGLHTLAFGPLKPIGLEDPRTGERPFAVVQLRPENQENTAFSLVGFQTKMTFPEQKRVFRLIPGLEQAEFLRYGTIHRNTFIKSPVLLTPTLQLRKDPRIFFAGQITGTEGYLAAAAGGWLAGFNAARQIQGQEPVALPVHTMMGALFRYIATSNPRYFQPMNPNFGLMIQIPRNLRRMEKRKFLVDRARESLAQWIDTYLKPSFASSG